MPSDKVMPGLSVRVERRLGSMEGWYIKKRVLARRTGGVRGTVWGHVPGHGGEVWWVQHTDGDMAPYAYDELKAV